MGVKRFDYIRGPLDGEGWIEEASLGQYVKAADYDAMAARATALEADRDRIELTLALAKADRDKWFNRARDLTAFVDKLERLAVGNVTGCGTCSTVVNEIVAFTKEPK